MCLRVNKIKKTKAFGGSRPPPSNVVISKQKQNRICDFILYPDGDTDHSKI